MSDVVRVRVPASAANLGPGFDCLGLALDLWNQATFKPGGRGVRMRVSGEGSQQLPHEESNLVVQAMQRFYHHRGLAVPGNLSITCHNEIPLSAGLGSSATAILLGLLGANALSGAAATQEEILELAAEMEGHADNSAASLAGGLVLVTRFGEHIHTRRYDLAKVPISIAMAVPAVELPTQAARRALPKQVPMPDAVFNLGHVPLVIEALCSGDLEMLGKAMDDRLHQPYRLPLIPGAEGAFLAARHSGAAAVAISGAGPGVVAFVHGDAAPVAQAMVAAFNAASVRARGLTLKISLQGAEVTSTS
jgi:homoserine kinase